MVGLLIITHNNVGGALFDAAISVLGNCPLRYEFLPVSQNCDPEERLEKAQLHLNALNQSDGVLVVTDMFGSTPSNIATKLASDNVKIITGLNLPMLIRIMNYPELSLEKLVNKAVSGGQNGVIEVLPVAQPLHQRLVVGLGLEPGHQGGIGATQRSVAVEVDPRVLQGALGDVDRDHHVVTAPAPGAAVTANLKECVLHTRLRIARRIDDEPRTLIPGRRGCQEQSSDEQRQETRRSVRNRHGGEYASPRSLSPLSQGRRTRTRTTAPACSPTRRWRVRSQPATPVIPSGRRGGAWPPARNPR